MVAAQGRVDLGGAPEFRERDHQRILEQPTLLEIVKQRRHDMIELGHHLLMGLKVLPVAVPPSPRHAHKGDSRLDQSPRHERLLAELRGPEAVAHALRLTRDVKE